MLGPCVGVVDIVALWTRTGEVEKHEREKAGAEEEGYEPCPALGQPCSSVVHGRRTRDKVEVGKQALQV